MGLLPRSDDLAVFVAVGSASACRTEFGHEVADWLMEVEYVLLAPVWGPVRVLAQRRGVGGLAPHTRASSGLLLLYLISFRTVKRAFDLVLRFEYLVRLLLTSSCEAHHFLKFNF